MTVYKNVLGSQNGGDGDHRGKPCFWESFCLIVFMWPKHLGLEKPIYYIQMTDTPLHMRLSGLYQKKTGKYNSTEIYRYFSSENVTVCLYKTCHNNGRDRCKSII